MKCDGKRRARRIDTATPFCQTSPVLGLLGPVIHTQMARIVCPDLVEWRTKVDVQTTIETTVAGARRMLVRKRRR